MLSISGEQEENLVRKFASVPCGKLVVISVCRWTTDPILHEGRFCNVFRVLDTTCQYMIHYVIYTGSQDPVELVFRVLLFDTFTRMDTWEYLIKKLGALTWENYRQDAYVKVLRKAVASGISVYTGSFQKPSPYLHYGMPQAFHNHLLALEALMEADLPGRLCGATSMKELYCWLRTFPGMGEFNTYQLLMNLTYTGLGKFTDADTFVVAGKGARAGLSLCFGRGLSRETELKIMQWMQRTQRRQLARLGLSCTLGPPGTLYHELQLCDIEHCLCEITKVSSLLLKTPSNSSSQRISRLFSTFAFEIGNPHTRANEISSHRKTSLSNSSYLLRLHLLRRNCGSSLALPHRGLRLGYSSIKFGGRDMMNQPGNQPAWLLRMPLLLLQLSRKGSLQQPIWIPISFDDSHPRVKGSLGRHTIIEPLLQIRLLFDIHGLKIYSFFPNLSPIAVQLLYTSWFFCFRFSVHGVLPHKGITFVKMSHQYHTYPTHG